MRKEFSVHVPASSGNIGPGFDVLGLALNFSNELRVKVLSPTLGKPLIRIMGEGETSLPRDSRNIIFAALKSVLAKAKRSVPLLELTCVNRIPLTRGLGSSSAAILSGLLAGNTLLNHRFSMGQILDWASEWEGHPDNVAPALFGGVRASGVYKGQVTSVAWPIPKIPVVVAIPSFELSTKKARAVLPKKILMQDAISNLSSVALMREALSGRFDLLKNILNDRWHEPYRAKLIPGFHKVKESALKAGAYGVTLSGAGPTILSFVKPGKVEAVKKAMQNAFSKAGVKSRVLELSVNSKGALIR